MIIEFYKVKILMLNFLHINVAGNVSFVVKKTTMLKFFLIYFNDCTENKKKLWKIIHVSISTSKNL